MSTSPKPERLLLNARETAEILNISTRLLWTKTKSGDIPSIRLGARVLYPMAKLRAWLESQGPQR